MTYIRSRHHSAKWWHIVRRRGETWCNLSTRYWDKYDRATVTMDAPPDSEICPTCLRRSNNDG